MKNKLTEIGRYFRLHNVFRLRDLIFCAFAACFGSITAQTPSRQKAIVHSLSDEQLTSIKFADGKKSALAVLYLQQFGYLAPAKVASSSDLDLEVREAVGRLQASTGLQITKLLDPKTMHVMVQPRCAFPDFDDPLGAIKTGPWARRELTYCFGSFGAIESQLKVDDIKAAIRNAFVTWSKAGAGLSFREVLQSASADIYVEGKPAEDPDRDMSSLLVAHADLPPTFSLIVAQPPIPLHFDESEKWTLKNAEGNHDLESIALHEIGHCLGLLHSNSPEDAMYGIVFPNQSKRNLSARDIQNLLAIYPQN